MMEFIQRGSNTLTSRIPYQLLEPIRSNYYPLSPQSPSSSSSSHPSHSSWAYYRQFLISSHPHIARRRLYLFVSLGIISVTLLLGSVFDVPIINFPRDLLFERERFRDKEALFRWDVVDVRNVKGERLGWTNYGEGGGDGGNGLSPRPSHSTRVPGGIPPVPFMLNRFGYESESEFDEGTDLEFDEDGEGEEDGRQRQKGPSPSHLPPSSSQSLPSQPHLDLPSLQTGQASPPRPKIPPYKYRLADLPDSFPGSSSSPSSSSSTTESSSSSSSSSSPSSSSSSTPGSGSQDKSPQSQNKPTKIPSILHFVPPGGTRFSFIQWLSMRTAIRQIRPRRTLVHMIEGDEPSRRTNFWWNELRDEVEVIFVKDPKEVWGNAITDVSHKADVIRMEALLNWGGIYVDSDTLVTRSFDSLMDEEMVMAIESARSSMWPDTEIEGLCNAIILASKGAPFLKRWWEEYRTFDKEQWNYHSVQLPWELAKNASQHGTRITVLDHRAFFLPLWDDLGMNWVHGTLPDLETLSPSKFQLSPPSSSSQSRPSFGYETADSPALTRFPESEIDAQLILHGPYAPNYPGWSFRHTQQFAYHLWHHFILNRIDIATKGALKSERDIGPEDVWGRNSSFNLEARKYVTREVLEDWRRHRIWELESKFELIGGGGGGVLEDKDVREFERLTGINMDGEYLNNGGGVGAGGRVKGIIEGIGAKGLAKKVKQGKGLERERG